MTAKLYSLIKSEWLRQSLRFAVVGAASTVINYAVNQIMITKNSAPELASASGYLMGVLIGYPLNKLWAFSARNSANPKSEAVKYFLLYLATFLLNIILAGSAYRLFNKLFDFSTHPVLEYIYYIPVIAVTTILNFIGCKLLVFKK